MVTIYDYFKPYCPVDSLYGPVMQVSIFAAIHHINASILLSTSIIVFTWWNKTQKEDRFNNNSDYF